MTSFNPGDIILIDLAYSDQSTTKKRPALVLLDEQDEDVVVARITSVYRPDNRYNYQINNLTTTGLHIPSCIRFSKILTVHKNNIIRALGKLDIQDKELANRLLTDIFRL